MNAVLAAVGVGAVGVAAVFIGLFALVTRHNGVGRRADAVSASDPQLARELRDVQAGIDRGTSRRLF